MLKKQNIPNALSFFRVFLAAIAVIFMLSEFGPKVYTLMNYDFKLHTFLAAIIFVIAALTDFIDGYLSRKYNWVSELGKFIDPVADKMLVNSVLIVLTYQGLVPAWATILFIARDITVDTGRMIMARKGITIAAGIWGKLKTVLQFLAIVAILFFFHQDNLQATHVFYYAIQNILILLALSVSLYSGADYVRKMFRSQVKNTRLS